LYVRFWRDKAATPKGDDCHGILARTAPRVAKEQRSGGSELENQAGGFKFRLREWLLILKEALKARHAQIS
jgi:hypothetical protein